MCLLFGLLVFHACAQLVVVPDPSAAVIAQILEGAGVSITNVEIDCPASAMGRFTGSSSLPWEDGLLLTTGSVFAAVGTAWNNSSVINQGGSDPDLAVLSGSAVYDVCILEFECIPMGDTLQFNYVFGSEEYPEFVCSFNDVFGLFLSGPESLGPFINDATNVALIPGSQLPVSINTIHGGLNNNPFDPTCPAINSMLYVNNGNGSTVAYDGMTTDLVATAVVVPGATYRFKLAVGDANDRLYDSGVFLQAFSFRSTSISTGRTESSLSRPVVLQDGDHMVCVMPEGHVGGEFRLFSITGAEVMRGRVKGDQVSISTEMLRRGVYVLHFPASSSLMPVRFVKE